MNRMMKAALAAVAVGGGLGSVGCVHTDDRPSLQDRYAGLVDPCWPERYSYTARQQVLSPFANHAVNGEIIDHTLFNYHFETGSDRLNPAGLEKLDYLARRRPAPPARVYLQTARDLSYDPATPEKLVATRQDLDARRTQAILRYLAASTAGRPLTFDVQVTDPADQSIRAEGPATAARGWPTRFQSGLSAGGGALTGAGGGTVTTTTTAPTSPGSSPGSSSR